MVILAESKSCETLLRIWKRQVLQTNLFIAISPLLLFGFCCLADNASFKGNSSTGFPLPCRMILLGLSLLLFCLVALRSRNVLAPEVRRVLDLCRQESLRVSEREVSGYSVSGHFHVPLREIKGIRIEHPAKATVHSSAHFPNDILILECIQQTYSFSSFSNCRELQTAIRILILP